MKKVALVFVLAVLLPSLVLAWLAVHSLRDQQFLLERQQSLLCQHVTDTLAAKISDYLAQQQQAFGVEVENLLAGRDARTVATQFDSELRRRWPLAEVGFCVTVSGKILSPAPNAGADARTFYSDNSNFLGNREAVEVYGNDSFAKNATLSYDSAAANQPANKLSSGFGGHKGAQMTLADAALAALGGQVISDNTTVRFKTPIDIGDFAWVKIRGCGQDEKEPVKWGFFRKG